MPDSLTYIPVDSVLFPASKDTVTEASDSSLIDFSSIEIIKKDSTNVLFQKVTPAIETTTHKELYDGVPRNLSRSETSIYLILLIACFAIFSFIFRFTHKAIRQSLRYFVPSGNQSTNIYKEQITTTEIWGKSFLIFQAILIIAIAGFLYFAPRLSITIRPHQYWIYFGICFMIISLFTALKYLFYKLIQFLMLDRFFDDFTDNWLWFDGVVGAICFIPITIHISSHQFSSALQILVFATFFISRILIYIKILDIFVKNHIGFLHYIVYLCTVEIAPYFVLYKSAVLLLNYVGTSLL